MEYTPTPRNNYTNAIINGNKILQINYEFSNQQFQQTTKQMCYYDVECCHCHQIFQVPSSRIKKITGCKKCVRLNKIKDNIYELINNEYYQITAQNCEYFLIDKEDYSKVSQFKWYCNASKQGIICTNYDTKEKYYLHRFLTNCPSDKFVDHINGDITDNRKKNLRIVTHKENMRNKKKFKSNQSGVTGVRYDKNTNTWKSEITIDGKSIIVGQYQNKEDAIFYRLEAEAYYFKEFSRNQKLFKKYNIHIDDYKTELDLKSNYINMVAQELNIDKNMLNDILNNLHLKLIKQTQ